MQEKSEVQPYLPKLEAEIKFHSEGRAVAPLPVIFSLQDGNITGKIFAEAFC